MSRAILKGFAAPGTSGRGWSLRPFNVARNEVQRDRGLRGCAYVRDFIMYAAQSAELAWKAVEDRLPQAITAARNGVLHASPSSDLRDTITDFKIGRPDLHLARFRYDTPVRDRWHLSRLDETAAARRA